MGRVSLSAKPELIKARTLLYFKKPYICIHAKSAQHICRCPVVLCLCGHEHHQPLLWRLFNGGGHGTPERPLLLRHDELLQ